MSKRLLECIGVLAAIIAVTVLLELAPVPVAGQAQTDPGQAEATPPDPTPWGEPDLQGIWTTNYQIPLERPARFADQEFFTDEERAVLDRERADINYRDPRSARGSEQDVGGAYNRAIYLTYKHTGRRTSLIMDPPDGRIPSFTPEAQKRRAELREYQLALLQATDTCKNNLLGCAGGAGRATVTEARGDASALPDQRRESRRRPRGPKLGRALYVGSPAGFWWGHGVFPPGGAVAWNRVDLL